MEPQQHPQQHGHNGNTPPDAQQPMPQPAQQPVQQPMPQQYNAPPQYGAPSPQVPQPVYTPAPTSATPSFYHSNPFAVTLNQLSVLIRVNPISTLTLGLLMLLCLFLLGIVGGLASGLVGGVIGSIIAFLLMLLGFVLIVLRFVAGGMYLQIASRAERPVTARQAVKEVAKQNYNKFLVTSIVLTLILTAGFIALVVPGLFLLGRLILAPFISLNEGISVGAALKRSWKLTSGHWFEMVSALLAESMTMSNGLLSFVGSSSGVIGRYYELTELEKTGTPKPKVHWMNFVLPIAIAIVAGLYMAVLGSAANQTRKAVQCSGINAYSSKCMGIDDTPGIYNGPNSLQYPTNSSDLLDCATSSRYQSGFDNCPTPSN